MSSTSEWINRSELGTAIPSFDLGYFDLWVHTAELKFSDLPMTRHAFGGAATMRAIG